MALSDYLNPESPTLKGRVDFAGMIEDVGKGGLLAIFSGMVGVVLSVKRAAENFVSDVSDAVYDVYFETNTILAEAMGDATQIALNDLPQFELFALPASVVPMVAFSIGVSAVVLVFLGES